MRKSALVLGAAFVLAVAMAAAASVMPGSVRANDFPSEDAIRKAVASAPGSNVFWTGRTGSCSSPADGVIVTTQNFARGRGQKTLEMRLRDAGINMPVYAEHNPDPRSKQLWRFASREFAAQSFGQAWVVKGTCVRDSNTWERNELPELKTSGKIKCIWEISATDFAHEKLIWRNTSWWGGTCSGEVHLPAAKACAVYNDLNWWRTRRTIPYQQKGTEGESAASRDARHS